jgi:hypothetical protein
MLLHSVLTYLWLVPEAFMMNGHVMEEKLVWYTMSFMAKDKARHWVEHQSAAVLFPFSTWAESESEFCLRFVKENKQDQALLKLESHGYFQGSRDIYRYTDNTVWDTIIMWPGPASGAR